MTGDFLTRSEVEAARERAAGGLEGMSERVSEDQIEDLCATVEALAEALRHALSQMNRSTDAGSIIEQALAAYDGQKGGGGE